MPFLETGMKIDLFQSCGHCWIFQISWHIECSTLIASSFRIWNSSTEIPSSPLAFFIVVLKAHLTSHSSMSGSGWMSTLSWLSGSSQSFFFFYSSSMYSFHLFLSSSISIRSLPFLSFIVPIFGWILIYPILNFDISFDISNFLNKSWRKLYYLLWVNSW